jgi:CHASE2 domain-containing sensor protein
MSGKIVLIGEINADIDSHPSVVGMMSGLDLQANYIEALLDDRYFWQPPYLDYAMGFAIMATFELILIVFSRSWLKLILLTVALFVAAAASLVLMVNLPHWYVNPSLVSALALFIRLLHVLFVPAERATES